MYLSEYDNVDRQILYQKESCASSSIQIVPVTVLEIGHNDKWIIAKSGLAKGQEQYDLIRYWVIKNDYPSLPDSEIVKSNTTEFRNRQDFDNFLSENKIGLTLSSVE